MDTSKIIFKKKSIKYYAKKIICKVNFNKKISIDGNKFVIPIINNVGFNNLISEDGNWLYFLMKKLYQDNNKTFIDIGANVGQTLLKLKSLGKNIKYIGFEPNPACIWYIWQLIRKNKFLGVKIVPTGLYSTNKLLNLYLQGNNDPGATIIEDLRPGTETENITVPVFCFETVKDNLKIDDIGIIKIDVEGAELDILKGIIPFLESTKPIFICEILWAHDESRLEFMEKRNEEIYYLLSNNHFIIYQILKSNDLNCITEFKKIDKFDNMVYTSKNCSLCDYIFIHKDKIDIIKEILN